MPFAVAVDIGGTFTDFVLIDDETGEISVYKCLTTPGDHGQPQSLAQIAVNLIDNAMDPQEAIEAPRIRHDAGNVVMHESRVPADRKSTRLNSSH